MGHMSFYCISLTKLEMVISLSTTKGEGELPVRELPENAGLLTLTFFLAFSFSVHTSLQRLPRPEA